MFVNFTDGTATFSSSETIDVTPTSNINLSRVELSGQHDPYVPVTFASSTIVAKDGTTVSFTLSEQERVDALLLTSHPGGSNSPVLKVGSNTIRDNAINFNLAIDIVQFNSSADILRPSIVRLHVDYNDGVLSIFGSETLVAELTDIGHVYLRSDEYNVSLDGSFVYPNTGVAFALFASR